MNSNIKELIKNALILGAITLCAGLLLGAVYEITKEPRAKQIEMAKENAYKEVMTEAKEFVELETDMAAITKVLEENNITEKNVIVDQCIEAYDDEGNTIGYIISVTSKEGYGGNISFSVGFDLSMNVSGVSILSISETAGLGMNAKEDSFLNQYKNQVEGSFTVGENIDAISGATITTNAMTKGVNTAKIVVKYILEGGAADE